MTTTINASTSSGLVTTPDNSGAIALQNAGVTGLNIDSGGRMTLPLQPRFCATDNGTNPSVTGPIVLPSTTVNIGSAYSTSTGKFTAPITGTYVFWFMAQMSLSSGAGVLTWLYNGSTYGSTNSYATLAGNYQQNIHVMIPMNAGDTVQPNYSSNLNSSRGNMVFMGYLLG